MRHPVLAALALLALPAAASAKPAAPAPAPAAGLIRVRIVTGEGPIVIAVDTRRAPVTAANFLAYVDDGRFDGTSFYRAARSRIAPKTGFIQGGISTDARRTLLPIPLEPTSKTGIRHLDATVSMARGSATGSAMGNFFITVGPAPNMDAQGDYQGYAAFGHVLSGMDTVRRILAKPAGGGSEAMKGQMILKPVDLITAKRLDGVAKPTSGPRPWLLDIPRRPYKGQ